MDKIEYLEKRINLLENVVDAFTRVFGSALPHCQYQLDDIYEKWDIQENNLDAELSDSVTGED